MLNKLALAGVLVIVVAMIAGFLHVMNQPIEVVSVRGELTQAERNQLRELLAPVAVDQGILTVSLNNLHEQVAPLNWAQNLSFRRVWPNTIEVQMQRTQPIARWGADEFVGPSGDLLEVAQDYPDLPRFNVAIETPAETLQHYRLLAQVFAREQLRVHTLTQTTLGEWEVLLTDTDNRTMQVYIGGDALSTRAHRVLKFYRRVLKPENKAVAYLDARYPNGVAVKFASEQVADAQGKNEPMLTRVDAVGDTLARGL